MIQVLFPLCALALLQADTRHIDASTTPAAATPVTRHVPGQLIARWNLSSGREVALGALDQFGCHMVGEVESMRLFLVEFDSGLEVKGMASKLMSHESFVDAHANGIGEGGVMPNDTGFSDQWHHRNTGQSGGTIGADVKSTIAWDITRGSESIVVAVLDSGIDSDHPEFQGRILPGIDFVQGDNDPEDDNGHGSKVTGLIAANAGNAFGVAGMDHRCKIAPVKILASNNLGTVFNLVQGIDWATAQGVDVVNMSLINYPATSSLQDALGNARAAGLILIACAGNGGIGNADSSWPGASPLTITVGATDRDDERASFSGTGAALDVVAPGSGVRTVSYNTMDDVTSSFTGCSAATPVVTGIVSLLLSLDPNLDHDTVRQILRDKAVDQVGDPSEDTPGRDDFHGHGRVDAAATVSECGIVRYCVLAAPNQTGQPARLDTTGTTSLTENDLVFVVTNLDPEQTGLIAYSPDQASMPLGNGILCLGSSTLGFVLRLPGTAPVGGVMTTAIDLLNPPFPAAQITPGSTWNFQSWNRDFIPLGAGFNFSDALSIRFCP